MGAEDESVSGSERVGEVDGLIGVRGGGLGGFALAGCVTEGRWRASFAARLREVSFNGV